MMMIILKVNRNNLLLSQITTSAHVSTGTHRNRIVLLILRDYQLPVKGILLLHFHVQLLLSDFALECAITLSHSKLILHVPYIVSQNVSFICSVNDYCG